MTPLPSLEMLKKYQKELLLAEVGALIHNIGKLSEEFLKYQANENGYKDYDYQAIAEIVSLLIPSTLTRQERKRLQSAIEANQEPKTAGLLSVDQKKWLQDRSLNLPAPLDDHTYALGYFIEFQKLSWYQPTKGGSPPRITLLFPFGSRASELLEASHHAASGVEKEGAPKEEGRQTGFPPCIATAFGLESPMKPDAFKAWRDKLLDALQAEGRRASQLAHLEKAVGDTRRPINEVRLSDLSFSVAGLFKSALAQAILSKKWTPRDDIRWRILRINFDVIALYAKALKIADLLAYQEKVDKACKSVKELVEEEYPLGNEVYRDSSGIYFTFPDLPLPDELKREIRRRVDAIEPELAPHIAVTIGDGATTQDQLKGILGKARGEAIEALKHPFNADNLNARWGQAWDERRREKKWEACPLCGLYPKLENDEVCDYCAERRKPRLKAWEKNPKQTIWLGEIADHHDRVALLVGKFGLDDWLSGDLVQTMLVKAVQNKPNECVSKNPSPARLRRVWETCEGFWSKTVQNILDEYSYGERTKDPTLHPLRSVRYSLTPDRQNGWKENFAYNGKVNGNPLDLFWQPKHNAFLTISNLQAAGEFKEGDTVSFEDPETKQKSEIRIQKIQEKVPTPFDRYQPFLPLLASPDQFLAFVPAAEALAIVREIQKQYAAQFGKVRNRLPLSLGVVYFERKMPLIAVMDSARHMLDYRSRAGNWQVQAKTDHNPTNEGWPRDVQLTLTCEGKSILVEVPTVMGDGQTPDVWYPYWRVEDKPTNRTHWFIGPDGEHWVHVKDLKEEDDTVHFTPSTFDFLWLDAAARRFEVHYDEKGRRPSQPTRPYFLEDLDRLEEVWGAFSKLSRTQLKQTLQTIETARERWFGRDGWKKATQENKKIFRQLVEDTLANAQWKWKDFPKRQKEQLTEAAVRGELTDWAELHLEIMKEKLEGENS